MKRKAELIGSGTGIIGGALGGAKLGTGVGIVAGGGLGMAATIPLCIIGGAIVGLVGNKIGSEIDRHKEKKHRR